MDSLFGDLFCNNNSQIPILRSCNVPVDILGDKLSYFENLLCNWPTAIPLHNLWVILIQPNSANLKKNILKVSRTFDPTTWEVENALNTTTNGMFSNGSGNYDLHNTIGCIFAQGVTIPGINIGFDSIGGSASTNNGFLKSPIITNRQPDASLEIDFLETNHSFTDYFIKPWTLLVGYYGLVSRAAENDIKSRITVLQLGKTQQCATSVIRKRYTFHDAVPVAVENDNLGYSSDSSGGIKKKSTWVYRNYTLDEVVKF